MHRIIAMKRFKERWEISKNWQLVYPAIGLAGLVYSAFKLSALVFDTNLFLTLLGTVVLFSVLLVLTLFIFKKLEKRWVVKERWQIIRIFLIFAVTGTTSLIVTKPIFEALGFTKEAFSDTGFKVVIFYLLKFFAILPFYKILLLVFGWVFGEYGFFLPFVKKMIDRFRLKQTVKH